MPTYFIRTPLPLDATVRAVFAQHHAEKTGNQLAVMTNVAGTECLVKVTCDHPVGEVLPDGFVPTQVIDDIDEARVLLESAPWSAAR